MPLKIDLVVVVLQAVAGYLTGQPLAMNVDTVTFGQHFTRTQFTQAGMSRSLRNLGPTLSAVSVLFGVVRAKVRADADSRSGAHPIASVRCTNGRILLRWSHNIAV